MSIQCMVACRLLGTHHSQCTSCTPTAQKLARRKYEESVAEQNRQFAAEKAMVKAREKAAADDQVRKNYADQVSEREGACESHNQCAPSWPQMLSRRALLP
jgi:hypothetical protein